MKPLIGLILILMGLLFKDSSEENSTQAYYIEFSIESEAYNNFTNLLGSLQMDVNNSTSVTEFKITTECKSLQTSGDVNCSCNPGFSWSAEVCANVSCCKESSCTFKSPNPVPMCFSSNTVKVNGSFTVVGVPFTSNLADPASADYNAFINKYTPLLQSGFSMLNWFDSLSITQLSQGSVVGTFEMLVTDLFEPAKIETIVVNLTNTTNATFDLTVTGLVKISLQPGDRRPIPYDSNASITCTPLKNLSNPTWSFQQIKSQDVTNGTEATVFYNDKNSTVYINHTTEVWRGTFTCDYRSNSAASILYTASQFLDIALLPQILIISEPQFPDCSGTNKQFFIKVQCIVPNTTENYTVTWFGKSTTKDKTVILNSGQIAYQAQKGIFCDENLNEENVTCEFQNRLNQMANSTLYIPIIKASSITCKADGQWEKAKSNYTAKMLCPTGVGLQLRNCINGFWESVVSLCINQDISNLLNDAMNLQRGLGIVEKNANDMFQRLSTSTTEMAGFKEYANINASVDVIYGMYNASKIQSSAWNLTVFNDFVKSSSNLLNETLDASWTPVGNEVNYTLGRKYLEAIEGIINQTNKTTAGNIYKEDYMQINIINSSSSTSKSWKEFNVQSVQVSSSVSVQTAIKNLINKLPDTLDNKPMNQNDIILSVAVDNNSTTNNLESPKISITFNVQRLKNHKMYCVFWNFTTGQWSDSGCTWGGVQNSNSCFCNHLSAFTVLVARYPTNVTYLEQITYVGLGCSIFSLTLSLVIELLVWNIVVKTNIAHFKHTVLVNIMVCLLIADCSFLADPSLSSSSSTATANWCLTLTVLKHFGYLAMFFWMLCLSLGLLHQVIFVFVPLRKKVYLGLCIFLGYGCPLIIVVVTFITYNNGSVDSYYSTNTCWLIYESTLTGSIHAFLFPVFVIVFLNMFNMVVVITRILKPKLSEGSSHDEKEVVRSIVKTVVLLTPTLGITWILGLFVLMLDLTQEPTAQIVNYAFTIVNSLQGFFIFLTGCIGEKKVRDALQKRFRPKPSAYFKSESSSRTTAATKQK